MEMTLVQQSSDEEANFTSALDPCLDKGREGKQLGTTCKGGRERDIRVEHIAGTQSTKLI